MPSDHKNNKVNDDDDDIFKHVDEEDEVANKPKVPQHNIESEEDDDRELEEKKVNRPEPVENTDNDDEDQERKERTRKENDDADDQEEVKHHNHHRHHDDEEHHRHHDDEEPHHHKRHDDDHKHHHKHHHHHNNEKKKHDEEEDEEEEVEGEIDANKKFVNAVKDLVKADDIIRKHQVKIKEARKIKKELEPYIIKELKKLKLIEINISDGKLRVNASKRKEPVTEEYVRTCILKQVPNDAEFAQTLTQAIYINNRKEKQQVNIKRIFNRNPKPKKPQLKRVIDDDD